MVDAITRVNGVGQVRVFGARGLQHEGVVDPDRMAGLGVTDGRSGQRDRSANVVCQEA